MTRRFLAVCALLAVFAASGCGNDTKQSNAYVDSVNAAQTQFASNFARLTRDITSSSTQTQDRKTLRTIAATTEATAVKLKGITPPDKVKALHGQLVDAISSYAAAITTAEQGLKGGVQQATQAEGRLASETARTSTVITNTITEINQKLR
jgi:hypothetical protein